MRRCIGGLAILLCTTVFLAGCGGGGGISPIAGDPYERPGTTVADKGFDMMSSAAGASLSFYSSTQEIDDVDDFISYLGSDVEALAQSPFPGTIPVRNTASPADRRLSAVGMLKIAQFIVRQRETQHTPPLDITGEDGWHWTGGGTVNGDSLSFSVTGTKAGVGTIRISSHTDGYEPDYTKTITITADIVRADGKMYRLNESWSVNCTENGASLSVRLTRMLDGVITASASYAGSGGFLMSPNIIDVSWSGQESIVSSDGYWVNMRLSDGHMSEYGLTSGTFALTASDGFTGTLVLSNGTWTGTITDDTGARIGEVYGLASDGYWRVTVGKHSETIYY